MIVTRGLGPAPALVTAGLGPISLIEIIPHAHISTSLHWSSVVVGQRDPFATVDATHSWASTIIWKRLGPFAGIMTLDNQSAATMTLENSDDGHLKLTER